jgi:DcuC family C4-dicarboxylate transporter
MAALSSIPSFQLHQLVLLGPLISLVFIGIVIWLLVKKYNANAVLLVAGLAMMLVALFLDLRLPKLKTPTGFKPFDLIEFLIESLQGTMAEVGLVIMVISGFVAYMDKIGASDALVFIAMKPLSLFKKYPYVLASLVLPMGQFLFISIPSAAGLGLLLMATVLGAVVLRPLMHVAPSPTLATARPRTEGAEFRNIALKPEACC